MYIHIQLYIYIQLYIIMTYIYIYIHTHTRSNSNNDNDRKLEELSPPLRVSKAPQGDDDSKHNSSNVNNDYSHTNNY